MTLTFIAYKPSRRFTAQITFQSVRCLQGISCPLVCSVLYSRGVNGKEVILRISICLENFQMIANGERKFPPLSLFSQYYHRIYSIHLNKIALRRRSVVST